MTFTDRRTAGRKLAVAVAAAQPRNPVVLALPRGGVPVADEIAQELSAPLDIVLVRKIGAPLQPELAIGALVGSDSGELVLNESIIAMLQVPDAYLEEERTRQLAELRRRRKLYRGDRPELTVVGKTAIVVDDGVATGATMRAALQAIRRRRPDRLILAIPVAPTASLRKLAEQVDQIICLEKSMFFSAIGEFYDDFHQLEDDEVRDILTAADVRTQRQEPPSPRAPDEAT